MRNKMIDPASDTLDRRGLFSLALPFIGLGLCFLAVGKNIIQFVLPPIREIGKRKVFITELENIPEGEMHMAQDLQGKPVALIRLVGSAPTAFSLSCTHLGCQIHWRAEEQNFLCPCHLGIFDKTGKVVSGPPPTPLVQYDVSVEDSNVFIKFPEV